MMTSSPTCRPTRWYERGARAQVVLTAFLLLACWRLRKQGAIATVLLAAMMIVACPDGAPPGVAEAQIITFPGGLPPGEVEAHVEIEASPEQVWAVLTDFSAYPIWNPFIYPVQGEPRPGTTLEITIHPGSRSIAYQATVVTVQPNRELTWSGRIPSSGEFDSTYSFTIEPIQEGRVRLISRETHKGLFAFLEWSLVSDIQNGLNAMTKSVRNRAELQRMTPRR